LKVIKQYGVEHHKALGGDGESSLSLFGLPFPTKMKYKPMAIPTSILIDEKGIIRWIDQAEDVRLRASEEKLLAALKDAFDD
jgi:peroxiredoxin